MRLVMAMATMTMVACDDEEHSRRVSICLAVPLQAACLHYVIDLELCRAGANGIHNSGRSSASFCSAIAAVAAGWIACDPGERDDERPAALEALRRLRCLTWLPHFCWWTPLRTRLRAAA